MSKVCEFRSCRGAIYVEYAVAIVPIFTLFWGMLQLNGLLLADLVVRDAAIKAVRAAIVCDSDKETSGASGATKCAQEAADDTIKSLSSIKDIHIVDVSGASSEGSEPVTVTVAANYTCEVPLVGLLACAAAGGAGSKIGTATFQRHATMPNQGHYYKF